MTKAELKNRISLALKDPMLQQGFEIICKENAELKNQCDTLDKSLVVSTKNNIERQKIIDEYKERIAELEKEKAELEKEKAELEKENVELEIQIEKMKCCGNCRWEYPCGFCDDCKHLDKWEIKENDRLQ